MFSSKNIKMTSKKKKMKKKTIVQNKNKETKIKKK